MLAIMHNFFQTHFKVVETLARFNATCSMIENDINYRAEFSNTDLYDLLFIEGKAKDPDATSKQATVITEASYTNEKGKFYQIKYTGWYSLDDTWYPEVNDRYLIFVSKPNGNIRFYEAGQIAENNYQHPRHDLQLHQFLNQECLLPPHRVQVLTM